MPLPRTIVFDLDGTLVDTAPDLIAALNFVLDREGVPPVPLKSARNMIGAGARKLIERGLELEGRAISVEDVNRLTKDFIDYYAAHIAERSRPFPGLAAALDQVKFGVVQFSDRGRVLMLRHSISPSVSGRTRPADLRPPLCGGARHRDADLDRAGLHAHGALRLRRRGARRAPLRVRRRR